MDIDFKSIILVIIIIVVIAITIFAGYKILGLDEKKEPVTPAIQANLNVQRNVIHDFSTIKSDKKDDIEEPVEETIEDGENEDEIENTQNSFNMANKPIEKNNYNPKTTIPGEEYVRRIRDYTRVGGKKLRYSIPKSWGNNSFDATDPVTGANLFCDYTPLSEYGDYENTDTTHEEFLQDFMDKEREKSSFNNVEFRTRELEIDSNNKFTIIEKIETYSITNYMVFLENGGVYSLSITVSNDEDYNDEFLRNVDNIFSTAYITTV